MRLKVVFIALLTLASTAFAADATLLKPPHGSAVAIVMFEDLQCVDCAKVYPIIWETADAHKIPVVLHDFPLPMHNWAFDAAVWARYFDQTSAEMGNEFRKFIYSSQTQITRDNFPQWMQKFAAENKTTVPDEKDPDGKLAELIKADYLLGQQIGVEHTPTIWVVSNSGVSQPLVEEVKIREKLEQMIYDMTSKAQPVVAPKLNSPVKAAVRKKNILKTPKKAG
ncbi:MAG TPA: thioredoxin domain-containing protein [Candidatus Angelobacter sp.]|nr:thioredoxin domain-containing protein [Candidatus Angelobacter sp.]